MFRQQQRSTDTATMTEEEARQVLLVEGTKRRKRQRVLRSLGLGSLFGLAVSLVLGITHMIPPNTIMIWNVAAGALNLLLLFGFLNPSNKQKSALRSLLPHAQLSDLAWLIEGLEYSPVRFKLVERLQELLPQVTAQDAGFLPEGARKILRSHISQFDASLPFRIVALEALLRIDDEKTSTLVKRLAKKKPQVPGEEALIAVARRALGQATADLVAPSLSTTEARQILQEYSTKKQRQSRLLLLGKGGILFLILLSLGYFLIAHNPFLFFGMLVLGTIFAGADAISSSLKTPNLTYQYACLQLVETAAVSDLPLLIDHIGQLQSHTHQELVYQSLTRLLNQLTPDDQHLLTPKVRKCLQQCLQLPAGSETPDWYQEFAVVARRVLEN